MSAMKSMGIKGREEARAAGVERRRTPVLWPSVVALAAWTLALLASLTGQNYLIDHHYLLASSHLPWLLALLVFLACWQIMTAAMMLPSSMPMMYMMAYAACKQGRPYAIQAVFLAGYALIWTLFAIAAFCGDTLIHWLVAHWFWLDLHSWLIGATTFALAGAFQFSPLKERCLKQCRSPFAFFVRYYRKGMAGAWKLGLRHGTFCLGCCWALMLIMFGLGVGSLVWMAVLTGVMVFEKTAPGGQRLRPFIGLALLALAALWLAHPAWLAIAGV